MGLDSTPILHCDLKSHAFTVRFSAPKVFVFRCMLREGNKSSIDSLILHSNLDTSP